MSDGIACEKKEHRKFWRVTKRRYNESAFNGYKPTPSDYSEIICLDCVQYWRTKAAYVNKLPDISSLERSKVLRNIKQT